MTRVLLSGCSTELRSYHSISPGCDYCRSGLLVVEVRPAGRRYRVAVVPAHLGRLYRARYAHSHRGALRKAERLLGRLRRVHSTLKEV